MTTAKKGPKAGKDTIYIDPDDEITVVIDKVEAAKQKVVALVLPKRFTTLQSVVNMRLLKRAADNSKKSVVLITSEAALLPLAGASGLHVAKNLQSKPEIPQPPEVNSGKDKPEEAEEPGEDVEGDGKLDHHRAVGELAAAHAILDMDEEDGAIKADSAAKTPKNKKLKVPDFDKFRLLIFAGVGALIALIIFLFFATSVLPKSTVTINTTSEPVSADFNFTTSEKAEALDEAEKILPSELKKADQTVSTTVQATGERNDGKTASGSITMTAQRCAPNLGNPSNVSAGTGVSSGGKIFITQSTASFSFDGFISGSCARYKSGSVGIEAQSAGSGSNVSNANFTVVGRSDVSASGSASGGTDDITKIISGQDIDNAKKAISTEESDKFALEFQENLEKEGYYVVEQTLKLSEPKVTSNPAVGEEAESADATVKVTYSAIVVKKDDLKKIIENTLNQQIDREKQELKEGDITEAASITVVNQGKNANATLNASVQYVALPKFNLEEMKKQIFGKKKGEIEKLLSSYPGVEKVQVDMSPFWVSTAPGKAGKITITLVEKPQEGNQEESSN